MDLSSEDLFVNGVGVQTSRTFRINGAIVMLITALIGVFINTLVIVSLWGRNQEKSGYLKIIVVKAIANNLICVGYLIWPIPVSLLDYYFLPPYFNTFMGQLLGWFAWTLGPLTQLLMNGNRVMAVIYPAYFSKIFPINITNIMLFICVLISGSLFSIGMIYDQCHYMFERTLMGWIHMDTPCGNNLGNGCVLAMFVIIAISNFFNFSIFIKLAAFSQTLSTLQASMRRRRQRYMLIQSVCQDLLIVLDTFDTTITSRNHPITQFLTMSFSMVFFRTLEGIIFLTMNERIHDEAKRLLQSCLISRRSAKINQASTNPLTLFVKSARSSKSF